MEKLARLVSPGRTNAQRSRRAGGRLNGRTLFIAARAGHSVSVIRQGQRRFGLMAGSACDYNWHLSAGPRIDRLLLHILSPVRQSPIACGEYQSNHVALSQMTKEIAYMDDSSRAALERARRSPR